MSREDQILDIVKNKLGIRIYKVSNGNILAYCPLHNDKNPSLSIRCSDGVHICFGGCSKGSLDMLVQQVLGIGPMEAKIICAGGEREITPSILKDKLFPINKMELTYCIDYSDIDFPVALNHPYLIENRKLTNDDIQLWGLRWDEKNNRIVMPIWDEKNELVTVTYRNLNPKSIEKYGKYTHTPNLKISHYLYGENLHFGGKYGTIIIVVEGPFDAIRLNQFGYAAVAVFNANLSTVQASKLIRRFDNVYLGFDNDVAGAAGMEKASSKLFGRVGVSYVYWEEKDAGDSTKEQIENAIMNAKSDLITKLSRTINMNTINYNLRRN
jgi:DNA primase